MIAMLIASALTLHAAPVQLFVGTYTGGQSKGIYSVAFDETDGSFGEPILATKVQNPSYLAVDQKAGRLYAIEEAKPGAVNSYRISEDTLSRIGRVELPAAGPCHVSLTPDRRNLLISSYSDGTLLAVSVNKDGGLSDPRVLYQSVGRGEVKGRQDAPHAHFSQVVGSKLLACDLGTNELIQLDAANLNKTGSPEDAIRRQLPGGAGPRHFVADRSGKFVYVVGELSNAISIFEQDQSGVFNMSSSLSPPETNPGLQAASAIRMHPSLPVLYTANRKSNTLTVYSLIDPKVPVPIATLPLDVTNPRDLVVSPNGGWLLVGGQSSNTLVAMPIDPRTGIPNKATSHCSIPIPVCLVW